MNTNKHEVKTQPRNTKGRKREIMIFSFISLVIFHVFVVGNEISVNSHVFVAEKKIYEDEIKFIFRFNVFWN
jgi:nitrate reductase NapE component